MKNFIEPFYLVDFNSVLCNFEIYINDVLLFKNNEGGTLASHYPINHYFLKSGKQKIEVKVFPEDLNKFHEESFIKIKIFSYDSATKNYQETNEILTFENLILGALNKPVFIFSDIFHADFPYTNIGWSKGIKVEKDSFFLIEKFYQNLYGYFKNKDIDKLVEIFNFKFGEVDRSLYLKDENNKLSLLKLFEQLDSESFIIQEFPNKLSYNFYNETVIDAKRENGKNLIYFMNTETNEEFEFPLLTCLSENEVFVVR